MPTGLPYDLARRTYGRGPEPVRSQFGSIGAFIFNLVLVRVELPLPR